MPRRALVIAVATAQQESSLRNLNRGDLDSLGVFQQRPPWWGPAEERRDPVISSTKFYNALLRVKNWNTMPLTEAAQAVQRSAHPDYYAKWEDMAEALVTKYEELVPTK